MISQESNRAQQERDSVPDIVDRYADPLRGMAFQLLVTDFTSH